MNDNIKFYAFEQYNFGIKILNFLCAFVTNLRVSLVMCIPVFVIFLLIIDDPLNNIFGFNISFLLCIFIFIALWTALNCIYIFTKKGVYIYNGNIIEIKNGYFANFNFLNFKRFKYTFYAKDIKNIDIDNRFSRINAWESAFFIPNKKDYVILELTGQYRILFSVEDNFEFVNEIETILGRGNN